MNEDHSRLTRWALGELSQVEAAEFESALPPVRRSEAEAHHEFCERAARALSQPAASLPSHKRAAILAAFASRAAAEQVRHVRQMRRQRALQAVLALCLLCGLAWILAQVPRHPFVAQKTARPVETEVARVGPGDLEVANYRLATLTAYLESAEARLRAAEIASEPPPPARKPERAPAPPPPKPVPEAGLHAPFNDTFPLAQIRLSL